MLFLVTSDESAAGGSWYVRVMSLLHGTAWGARTAPPTVTKRDCGCRLMTAVGLVKIFSDFSLDSMVFANCVVETTSDEPSVMSGSSGAWWSSSVRRETNRS